jgi:Gpi18-like mannosyltransferase
VIVNSAVWGQCDAFYTIFVVGALAAAMGSQPLLALCLFGVAVSTKLQAMLLAPAIALLLISRRLPWRVVPASIICYCVSLLPAALAGRPWIELLNVYLQQYDTHRSLSMDAPNLWSVLRHVPMIRENYDLVLTLGLLATAAVGIVYLVLGRRQLLGSSRNTILEIAFVSVFIFPFLLPKMHDRYFFPADVLSVALALVDRRWLTVAVLVQIGSLAAYVPYLLGWHTLALGVVANTLVFFAISMRWFPRAQQLLPRPLRNMMFGHVEAPIS